MSRLSSGYRKSDRRSKSPVRSSGTYMTEVPASSLLRRSDNSKLRKSTGSLAANFGTSGKHAHTSSDLEHIESEYIKNLQQQVYFLELEANYLREQAKTASDMHPQMTAEAERMLSKLRHMQAEIDGLYINLKSADSSLEMAKVEKQRIEKRQKQAEDTHQREKRLLLDEIVQLKKEKDLLERENSRKDSQIMQAREELEKSSGSVRSAETKIQMLRNQLDQKIEQQHLTQTTLEEKRTELLKVESQLREFEDKYYSSTVSIQNKVTDDLRDEVRLLRQKLKESEISADQDRFLRNKLSDDSSHIIKENALLNQQVIELQKQLEREKDLRDSNDNRRSQNITELVMLRDREKQLKFELDQTRDQLNQERGRVKHYMQNLAKQEQVTTATELNRSTTQSRLAELEGIHQSTDVENAELRRDKMLLVDHVSELQSQLDHKEKEVLQLESHIHSLDLQLKDLEHLKGLESSVHSQKWEEFSRLAESMKTLSRSMARSGSPRQTIDYS